VYGIGSIVQCLVVIRTSFNVAYRTLDQFQGKLIGLLLPNRSETDFNEICTSFLEKKNYYYGTEVTTFKTCILSNSPNTKSTLPSIIHCPLKMFRAYASDPVL